MNIKKTELLLSTELPVNLAFVIDSHGWSDLLPNHKQPQGLRRVTKLQSGQVILLDISAQETQEQVIRLEVFSPAELSQGDKEEIFKTTRTMLRLNENLNDFYTLCRSAPAPWNKLQPGQAKLLCSPSVFEDVIRCICTTNIQWGGTKRMVNGLVNTLGESFADDPQLKTFPGPEVLAEAPAQIFSETVRLGYRSEYVHLLARRVTSGELDLEGLRSSSLPTADLKKELLKIKGIGNYAAATLLMLLGRYDELPMDTVFRSFVQRKYFNGEKVPDLQAAEIYQDWGEWKYLAYWYDLWNNFSEA